MNVKFSARCCPILDLNITLSCDFTNENIMPQCCSTSVSAILLYRNFSDPFKYTDDIEGSHCIVIHTQSWCLVETTELQALYSNDWFSRAHKTAGKNISGWPYHRHNSRLTATAQPELFEVVPGLWHVYQWLFSNSPLLLHDWTKPKLR